MQQDGKCLMVWLPALPGSALDPACHRVLEVTGPQGVKLTSESVQRDSSVECMSGSGAWSEVVVTGGDPKSGFLSPAPQFFLVPGHHGLNRFPLPCLSTIPFLLWSP